MRTISTPVINWMPPKTWQWFLFFPLFLTLHTYIGGKWYIRVCALADSGSGLAPRWYIEARSTTRRTNIVTLICGRRAGEIPVTRQVVGWCFFLFFFYLFPYTLCRFFVSVFLKRANDAVTGTTAEWLYWPKSAAHRRRSDFTRGPTYVCWRMCVWLQWINDDGMMMILVWPSAFILRMRQLNEYDVRKMRSSRLKIEILGTLLCYKYPKGCKWHFLREFMWGYVGFLLQ